MERLKFVTLNVRGLKNKDKRNTIFEWFRNKNIDVALIQETYCDNEMFNIICKEWNGQVFLSPTTSNHSRGVLVLIGENLSKCKDFSVNDVHLDANGRMLILNASIYNEQYCLINLYCPNNQEARATFFDECVNIINDKCSTHLNIIIGGDFNSVVDEIDKKSKPKKACKNALIRFMSRLEMTDIWRKKNPDSREYTYIDPSNRGQNSRIDKLLTTDTLLKKVKCCYITNAPTPDHKAVIAEIMLKSNSRGKGYWKLNSSVVNEIEYQVLIKDAINDTCNEYGTVLSKCQLWQFLKARIKENSIRYCILKAQSKKDEVKRVENELNLLDKSIALNPPNVSELIDQKN